MHLAGLQVLNVSDGGCLSGNWLPPHLSKLIAITRLDIGEVSASSLLLLSTLFFKIAHHAFCALHMYQRHIYHLLCPPLLSVLLSAFSLHRYQQFQKDTSYRGCNIQRVFSHMHIR